MEKIFKINKKFLDAYMHPFFYKNLKKLKKINYINSLHITPLLIKFLIFFTNLKKNFKFLLKKLKKI